MTLPHPVDRLAWRYVTLTYRPNEAFYGFDTVRFMATDNGGLVTFVTTINFTILQRPCQNGGTCQGEYLITRELCSVSLDLVADC